MKNMLKAPPGQWKSEVRYEFDGKTIVKTYDGGTMLEVFEHAKRGTRDDYRTLLIWELPQIVGGVVLSDGCSIVGYINCWLSGE